MYVTILEPNSMAKYVKVSNRLHLLLYCTVPARVSLSAKEAFAATIPGGDQ